MRKNTQILAYSSLLVALACDVESNKLPNQGVTLPQKTDAATNGETDAAPVNSADAANNSLDAGNTNTADATASNDAASNSDAATNGDAASAVNTGDAQTLSDAGPPSTPALPAPRGVVVIQTDYDVSANVSIFDVKGKLLSSSLISSGSENPGLSAALSGDIVPPTTQLTGDEIVLIDRSNSVLSWVDLESAEVRQQVNVGPGDFSANPQDYIPYNAHTAFVTRFEKNGTAGTADLDSGDDVLVLDPSNGELLAEIDLSTAADSDRVATPTRALMAGGYLRVSLIGYQDYDYAEARVVTIDPQTLAIVDVHLIEGIKNCTNLVLAPDGQSIVLGCTGPYAIEGSAIVQLSVDAEPRELLRVLAEDLGGHAINTVEFISDSTLAYTTYGEMEYAEDGTSSVLVTDAFRVLDLETGEPDADPVAVSEDNAFSLNEVRCIAEAKMCLLADGTTDGGQLRRFKITDTGRLTETTPVGIEDGLVLPPHYLGLY